MIDIIELPLIVISYKIQETDTLNYYLSTFKRGLTRRFSYIKVISKVRLILNGDLYKSLRFTCYMNFIINSFSWSIPINRMVLTK